MTDLLLAGVLIGTFYDDTLADGFIFDGCAKSPDGHWNCAGIV